MKKENYVKVLDNPRGDGEYVNEEFFRHTDGKCCECGGDLIYDNCRCEYYCSTCSLVQEDTSDIKLWTDNFKINNYEVDYSKPKYTLKYTEQKKGKQLELHKNNKYVTSVTTKKDLSKSELLNKLKAKVDLSLDWNELLFSLDYRRCAWCGKTFKKVGKKIYCCPECANKAKNAQVNDLHAKEMFVEPYLDTAARDSQKQRDWAYHERDNDNKEFNEDDRNWELGSGNLTGKPHHDFFKEMIYCHNELMKFQLDEKLSRICWMKPDGTTSPQCPFEDKKERYLKWLKEQEE